MGLFLVGLVLIIGGVLLIANDFDFGGFILGVGAIMTIILIIIATCVPSNSRRLIFEYRQDVKYLEAVFELDFISHSERDKAVELILSDNRIIGITQMRDKNFWVNVFYSKEVGELELFDVSRVPQVNGRQELNINN